MAKGGTSPTGSAQRRAQRAQPDGAARAKSTVETKPAATAPARAALDLSNFDAVSRWLLDRTDFERIPATRATADLLKLDRMSALLQALDDPHTAVKTVHVAGTKGKGSVCEMTAASLEACGYTVGIYTSPHILTPRERIRINRKPVTEAEFTGLAQRVERALATIDLAPFDGEEPTYFELVTAMGFLHFAEQAVDAAVIEVGLGGRLDSTNLVRPEVVAITSLSLDHTQILGDTLAQIAREKAGIFKPGVPAITCPQEPEAMEVLRAVAAEVDCPLLILGEHIEFSRRFENSQPHGPRMRVSLTTARNTYEHLPVPLPGDHQAVNCGLALAVLDRLSERGFVCPESRVTSGLASVSLPGRTELAWRQPRVILDGAHNVDSIRALLRTLGTYVTYDSLIIIFGCAADKDVDGMLKELALGADKVIFTRSAANARAADPRDLARRFAEHSGKTPQSAPTLPEALAIAQRAVGRDDLLCITGSFYLVGAAKAHFNALAARKHAAAGAL
ncbi:MAG: bifunctional folylpolyglutamate synthase/dihydrofolate synthase [Phycisphaeraceae bacterium]|nr:bifunctional folylpolyglutamate synthase/dihydrofolate synthase [Phycisphaeraceae bacterium]